MKTRLFRKQGGFLLNSYLNSVKNLKSIAPEEPTRPHPLYQSALATRMLRKPPPQQHLPSPPVLPRQPSPKRYNLDSLF